MKRTQPSQSDGTADAGNAEHLSSNAAPIPPDFLSKTEAASEKGHGELILVIDDEEHLRELTKAVLISMGYQVLTAQDGLEGVALFGERREEIKLVVTDASMPRLDGIGAIRAIRELKPQLPIILTSGAEGNTEEIRTTNSLHVIRLLKPYSLGQLRLAIAVGLRRSA